MVDCKEGFHGTKLVVFEGSSESFLAVVVAAVVAGGTLVAVVVVEGAVKEVGTMVKLVLAVDEVVCVVVGAQVR